MLPERPLPLVLSGLVRGAITGVLTGLAVVAGIAFYAIVEGESLDEGVTSVYVFGMWAAFVGGVVGAALGCIIGLLLTPFRRHLRRIGPWAGFVALIVVGPSIWWWWFERNAMPFDVDRDAGAVIGLPLAAAALTVAAAWTVPGGKQGRPRRDPPA